MDTRCKLCDWSPDGPSLYSTGVVSRAPKRHTRKLILDKWTGDTICTVCLNQSEVE